MHDVSAFRLPYSQQFSPGQTPLKKLLGVLRSSLKRGNLKAAIAASFFKENTDSEKLAGNTISALRSWGIISPTADSLTAFGKQLMDLQGSIAEAHRLLARRFLRELGGTILVETLREMKSASIPISLHSLPPELRTRGLSVSDNSSDLSSICAWLREANVLKDKYDVNIPTYENLTGTSIRTLDAMRGLNATQICFLQALLAMNATDWTPYNDVARYAEGLFPGEVTFNWKTIGTAVLNPLQKAGLVELRKSQKQDAGKPEGRGGKPSEVRPTTRFETEVAEPLLMLTLRVSSRAEVRKLRSESLATIWSETASNDANIRGNALERLAVRLCQMLSLDYMGIRETDEAVTGGGEVDAMMESARLVYSRWQVQCKTGNVTFGAVAKEVGMHTVSLANVILIISTGVATDSAKTFRKQIVATTHLNIIFITKSELNSIIEDPSHLPRILKEQALEALSLKPRNGLVSAT